MNQDQVINLNQNAANCIHSATSFGETVYTNICNGNVSHITWGGADWVLCFFLFGLCAAFGLFLTAFAVMLFRD